VLDQVCRVMGSAAGGAVRPSRVQNLMSANPVTTPLEPWFLANLDSPSSDAVLAAAQRRQVPAKQTLLTLGHPASQLFMLRQGRARYFRLTKSGEEVVLHLLAPGDVFGLGSLLGHPTAYLASAETLSECELLVWDHAIIRGLAEQYPQLAENALRIVLHYLNSYVSRHVALVSGSAEQRLARTLLDLGNRTGRVHSYGVEIDANNEQLSGLADISRFTASRLLRRWARAGVVSKGRGRVVIREPEGLTID